METRSWSFTDKSGWPDGPWRAEPDKLQWVTEAGLPGLIVRNGAGALCGYVGIPEGHPWFAKRYSECATPEVHEDPEDGENHSWCNHSPGSQVEVHGGLTFSDFCSPDHERGICHTPGPGEPDRVWWLGFDCGHSFDYAPGYQKLGFPQAVYRDLAYTKRQVERLAAQLAGPR